MASLKLKGRIGELTIAIKLAIGIGFVVVLAGAYFFVLFGDVSGELETKATELEEQQAKLNDAEAAKREYNNDLAEKARLEALARKQKKVLPDDAEMPTFLSTIQSVATISGATLASWAPGEEQKEEFYARVPMQLKLEGKFHQVAKFFHGIGMVDRIINMENITVHVKDRGAEAKASSDDKGTMVTVECLATAFRALAKNEKGKKRRQAAEGAPPPEGERGAAPPAAEEKKE